LFTLNKGPWKIIYRKQCSSELFARNRELKIKSYKGDNAFS